MHRVRYGTGKGKRVATKAVAGLEVPGFGVGAAVGQKEGGEAPAKAPKKVESRQARWKRLNREKWRVSQAGVMRRKRAREKEEREKELALIR